MPEIEVKISYSAHETVRLLAGQIGLSEQEIVERAIEQYRRKAFLEGLSEDFRHAGLERDEDQTGEAERDLWDNTLQDGLENE